MTRRPDWLIHQLPVGMVEDEFLVRFLRIPQSISDTLLHQIDALPHSFDPDVAPDAMVRLMGAWLGIDFIDSSLPDHLQRRIVNEYSSLLQWRGTARGVGQLLELVSGAAATVEDSGGVFLEGEAPIGPPHVRLYVESVGWATEADLLRIVRSELPASVTFELQIGDRVVWPYELTVEGVTRALPTTELASVGSAVPADDGVAAPGASAPTTDDGGRPGA